MLWTLLIKDLRRARHNPWPYLLNLALPLCNTALIGLVFGPSSKGGGLGQITFAVVDEDDSVLSSLLRGAMNQGDFKKHLEARFLEIIEKEGRPDMKRIAGLLVRVGDRFEQAGHYLFPPLIGYEATTHKKAKAEGPALNIFAFLLPGMAAMFLLFLADHAIRDLYREISARTLDRFRTLNDRLLPFIVSKVVLAMAVVVLGSIVIFGGSVLIFGIHWERPLAMAGVILAFGLFGSGFMAFLAALARSERRANAVNSVMVMCLSFVGGSFFPARQLTPLFRDHLSPLMPNYWFIETLRELQSGGGEMPWAWTALKLSVFGLALVIAASWIFQRALAKGIRA